MPGVYDAQQVAVMLRMVQAAMQYKSQELDKERSSTLQLRKEVDDLQESLENVNWLFAQVDCDVRNMCSKDIILLYSRKVMSRCGCRSSNIGWDCKLNWRQQRLQLQIYVRCYLCSLVTHLDPALTLPQMPADAFHLIMGHHGD